MDRGDTRTQQRRPIGGVDEILRRTTKVRPAKESVNGWMLRKVDTHTKLQYSRIEHLLDS